MIFRSCITMILAKNEENPWSTCLLLKTHFPWVLENEKYLHQQRSYVDFCILWKQSFKVLIESQALFNLKQKKNKACYRGKNLVQMNMKKILNRISVDVEIYFFLTSMILPKKPESLISSTLPISTIFIMTIKI